VAAAVGAQAAGVGLAQVALDLVPHVRSVSGTGQHSVRSGNGPGRGHTPVTLCHATSSQTNPYVVITTDDDGVLGAGSSGGNGHDSHSGDIIPPFDYTDNKGNPQSYPGKNWDAVGQAIFANECEPPSPPPPPPCPDDVRMTGGEGNGDDNGCEPPPPPPCPDDVRMTGGNGENGDGDNGCEPPPCPDDVRMTGGGGNGDGDNGCEPPPPPCPDDVRMTGGGGNGEGDDECEEEKPKLVVKKTVVNDDGGTATPDDFSFRVNGGSAQQFESDGRNVLEVDPGTYTVTEPPVSGYATTYDNCTDLILAEGDREVCTITNDDEPAPPEHGRVIVEKVMNGGTDTFEFTGTPAGSISVDGGTISADVTPGQYTSTELPKAGWNLGSISCDDENSSGSISQRKATFRVEEGETVTCTFRNRKRSMVIVKKLMVGGTDTFEFTGTPEGAISASGGTISADVSPGTYTSTEAAKNGWALTSIACDDANSTGDVAARTATFRASPGETVTCTFTNERRAGSIVVQKQTHPDGHPESFDFDASYDANGFSLSDGEQNDSGALLPGTYAVSENVPAGWSLTSATCSDGSDPDAIELSAGENVTCVFENTLVPLLGRGEIDVQKSASPTSLKEPGGLVTFSVTIKNVSVVNVAIQEVVDDKFGDLDDEGGNGCFDVPINLMPMESVNCTFQREITGPGGTSHVNTVAASGRDAFGNFVFDSDDARVDLTPRLIDLVIVKEASSPTPLKGTVNYSLTVTNRGPDTATDVQVADPAPAGIVYLTATPSQGTCNVGPALVTCSLGTIAPGQTVTVAITARATAVGSHTNTATVTGSGGREIDPATNSDSAVTVVPAPPKTQPPPTPKPPVSEPCTALTVSPKMIKADGKPNRISVRVTAGNKRVKGVRVTVRGAGVERTGTSNGKGLVVLRINPRKAGIITVSARETNRKLCGPKRIGVVGVFLPPVTG
jgi:uncharacterized repeat protein (TIGR01451 family)